MYKCICKETGEVLCMMKKCGMAKTFMVDKFISLSTLKLSINDQGLKITQGI